MKFYYDGVLICGAKTQKIQIRDCLSVQPGTLGNAQPPLFAGQRSDYV